MAVVSVPPLDADVHLVLCVFGRSESPMSRPILPRQMRAHRPKLAA